jgi:hypothetical protein
MSHDVNTSNAGPTSATVSPAKLRILLACGVKDYDGMAGKATDLPAWSPEGLAAMGLSRRPSIGNWSSPVSQSRPGRWRRHCTPGGLAHRTACRSSLTARTPNPGMCSPVTGSWMRPLRPGDEIAGRLAGCTAPEHVVANSYADVRPIVESAAEVSVSDERR